MNRHESPSAGPVLGSCPHGVVCPRCGAGREQNCRTRKGRRVSWWHPHRARHQAFAREVYRRADERARAVFRVRVPSFAWPSVVRGEA